MSEINEELIEQLLSRKLEAESAEVYIQRFYGKIYSVQDVADALGLGYHSLRKKFKQKTGQSIGKYLIETKVENARILLEQTNLSVKEIAFQVGFKDPSQFSKVFKRYMSVSPWIYRTSKRALRRENLN